MVTAASRGDLFLVKYFCQRDFPKHQNACEYAASYGHINCLKCLHEHGWPWDKQTCNLAAKDCHIECLSYSISNGCSYNFEELYEYAKYGGDKGIEKYLLSLQN